MIRSTLIFLALIFVLNAASANSGVGTGVGNAGGVVISSDGSVQDADPFIVDPNTPFIHYKDLGLAVRADLELIGKFLTRYGAHPGISTDQSSFPPNFPKAMIDAQNAALISQETLSRTAQSKFLIENVMGENVEYHFVQTLPADCAATVDNAIDMLPGSTTAMAGCTVGVHTYVREDLFSRMDVPNRVMLLLHERLHSLNLMNRLHQDIINTTAGASMILSLYQAQTLAETTKTAQSALSLPQVQLLTDMFRSVGAMSDLDDQADPSNDVDNWAILPNGGGLAARVPSDNDEMADTSQYVLLSKVDPEAFVGVGSILSAGSEADSGVLMINSSCYSAQCNLGANAQMLESAVFPLTTSDTSFTVTLSPGAQLLRSELGISSPYQQASSTQETNNAVQFSSASEMSDSFFQGVKSLKLEAGADVSHSHAEFSSSDGTQTSIDIGVNSLLIGLSGSKDPVVHFNVTKNASGKSGIDTLLIPENQTLNFATGFDCPVGEAVHLSSDLSITSAGVLAPLCGAYDSDHELSVVQ